MANKKIRKMVILAKPETTRGIDAAPTGANAIIVANANLTPIEGDEVEHNYIKPFFGNSGSAQATAYNKVSFDVELAGSGAAGTPPGWSALMRACACAVTIVAGTSVTYSPISESLESLTIYANIDGTNHIMRDVKGNVKVTADAKGLPKLNFEFTGLFTPLAATTLPAATYSNFLDAIPVNKTNTQLSLLGIACAASAFSFDMGLSVVKRDLTNVDSVEITDRKSTASVTFENHAIGTKDWVGSALASETGVLQLIHGTVAGNIIEINAAHAQVKKPSYSDSDGIQMITTPLALRHGTAGNDEWSIVVR